MAERYNFKYLPLVGKLPGKSMVEQTESAINELASVVYDNVGYVGNLAEEVQTANTNASNALEKATEALETSGRVYIKQIASVDVNEYYDSELYYINNDGSINIPVRDKGFLEVKTNDDKTDCEQVFIADSTGTPYYRHGVITEQTLGEETTYVVTWGSWYRGATAEFVQAELQDYVTLNDLETELQDYLPLSGGTMTGAIVGNPLTLTADDGNDSINLVLNPSGSATWNGKEVERVNASGNGYIRYDSGLQICFGSISGITSSGTTITFPAPFKDTSYVVLVFANGYNINSIGLGFTSKTTTSVLINRNSETGAAANYLIVGYWK